MRLHRHIGRHASARGYSNTYPRNLKLDPQPRWIRRRRCSVTVSHRFRLLERYDVDMIATREIYLLSFWIVPEQGRMCAHHESCWRQPHNPVDQCAFGTLLLRPDGVTILYSVKFDPVASRRRVPRLLFQFGLFPCLGDVALFFCFHPCLGLFIYVRS